MKNAGWLSELSVIEQFMFLTLLLMFAGRRCMHRDSLGESRRQRDKTN